MLNNRIKFEQILQIPIDNCGLLYFNYNDYALTKKNFYTCFLILLLAINNLLWSQERVIDIKTSQFSYAEKIYLQLSSTIFISDDVVWFKAIVTDVNHLSTDLSGILYVELIDFEERIIDQKVLKLKDGIASSSFQLNQQMLPGRYLIRAYTEWNKNFNEDFIYNQYIDIYASNEIVKKDEVITDITLTETLPNQFELTGNVYPSLIDPNYRGKLMVYIDMGTERDSIEIKKDNKYGYRFNYVLPENAVTAKIELKLNSVKQRNNNLGFTTPYRKTIVLDKNYLDLQFFPEGGKLVDGLISKVAFKALDYKNESVVISGHIVDQYDSIIVPFKTNTFGMGFTDFKPNKEKKYYGVVENSKGVLFRYKLPEVFDSGYVLRANNSKDYIRIAINSTILEPEDLVLKVQSRGITYHDINFTIKEGFADIAVEKDGLPEGIIKFTILHKNESPICERLIFNHKDKNKLEISAKTDLKTYRQRDRTVINLTTKGADSSKLSAHLSVLILNKEQLGNAYETQQNILSYFLLNSELRGAIEKPAYYFDEKNTFRYRDLDALMLTQGWRNYIYKDSPNKKVFKVKPEKSLVITGTVGEFFNSRKRPKKPIELTLMTFGKSQTILSQKIDSTGRFNFNLDDDYTDALEILIQSKSGKGKNKDYTINLDKRITPKIQYARQEHFRLADSIHTYVQRNRERKLVEQAFEEASGTITLDEVELSGYRLTPEREKMLELHGPPDLVIEDKELHKKIKKWSYGLFSVLMFNYPKEINVRRVGPNGGFLVAEVYGADFTFIIIDGIPVRITDYSSIASLPTEEIKSVEIIENPKNARKYIVDVFGDIRALDGLSTPSLSFINIYTYSKKGLYGVQKTSGLFKSTISGFSPKLEFYAPKHVDLNTADWKVPDLRSVLHWSPNIVTDLEGNAKVDYYNDDNIGEMLVIIEGITSDGKIGYHQMTYSVDKKLER